MLQPAGHSHILLNEAGKPVIAGTRFKVRDLVKDYMAYGWSPEEMQWQHPSLSMAQVHAALAYYYDHKQDMDEEIQRDFTEYQHLRAESMDSPVRRRLRDLNAL